MPQFAPSSVHKATITFSNPKSAGFDYTASLCMGTDVIVMASASFHLDAGQSKPVTFSVTMPAASGIYPVYISVSSGGKVVALYKATEDITIAAPAQFVYVSAIRLTLGAPYYDVAVDIKNVGAGAGLCVITISDRLMVNGVWSGWGQVTDYVGGHNPAYNGGYYLRQATIQPGQTVTFSGWGIWCVGLYAGVTAQQVMIISAAGSKQTGGFAYVSAIYVAGTGYWAPAGVDVYFIEVKVQNVGAGAGTCYNELWVQFGGLPWGMPTGWIVGPNLDLAPGQVGTLRWWAPHFTARTQQYKIVGDAGTIIGPIWQLN